MSGPKLGRPKQDEMDLDEKKIARQDEAERNAVEGKIGEGKRQYGLVRISAWLRETGETVIALQFLIMNLEKILWETFLSIFYGVLKWFLNSYTRRILVKELNEEVIKQSLIVD